ncbi:MAG TPA: DUF5522 domain-containing protein [Pyrinomonadaceae bacterium]|nr:DUF5522 domain-containing protein [Pyrinomonadaceae bacterium]
MREQKNEPRQERLVEGEDHYFENGLMVLTERFLLKRGYCCENGCRHCPYGFSKDDGGVKVPTCKEL